MNCSTTELPDFSFTELFVDELLVYRIARSMIA